MVDVTKAFEVDNGIVLGEDGAGVFSGNEDPPTITPADGSIYTNGAAAKMWHRHDSEWHLFHDSNTDYRNSVSLFISDINGQNINTGSYSAISFKPVAGKDSYISPSIIWGVVAESSSGGTLDIRIVRKSDGFQLGTLNWNNETEPTLKTLDITSNFSTGDVIYQLEGKRVSGAGKLYSSGLEIIYG